MKTMIQLIVVALIAGGLSATGTIFLQRKSAPIVAGADQSAAHADPPESKEAGEDHSSDVDSTEKSERDTSASKGDEHSPSPAVVDDHALAAAEPPRSHSGSEWSADEKGNATSDVSREPPVAVRPPYTPEGDEGGVLINLLRERARGAGEKERRIAERQDAIKLIFDDLRAEQAQTLRIREQLMKEIQASRHAVDSALQSMDSERNAWRTEQAESRRIAEDALKAANEERDKLRKQLEKATSPAADPSESPRSADDNANLKKMATVFDSMPAENVAKVFEQLVKNKRMDAVVSLLNAMKERQAAKVLGIITEGNASLAADLTDRLKRLKSSITPPATE